MFKRAEHTDIPIPSAEGWYLELLMMGPIHLHLRGGSCLAETGEQLRKCLTSRRLPSQQDSAKITKVAQLGQAICKLAL